MDAGPPASRGTRLAIIRGMTLRPNARLTCVAALLATAATFASISLAGKADQPRAKGGVKVLAKGLSVPWGLDFLPNGSALVTERATGDILRIPKDGGKAKRVMSVPGVDGNGEGGLLGLVLSPHYKRDRLVYAYLTTRKRNRIVRSAPGKPKPILTGIDRATYHNGGRIEFGPDGMLYAGVGDAGNTSSSQNRGSLNGKILRINPKGGTPRTTPSPGHRSGRSATATSRASPGTARAGCGRRSSAGPPRQGKPDQAGTQRWLARGRGRRRHPGR